MIEGVKKGCFEKTSLSHLYTNYSVFTDTIVTIEACLDEKKSPAEDVYTIAKCNLRAYNNHQQRLSSKQRSACLERALRLHRTAASRGHARAHMALGKCYELGTGVPQDHMRAMGHYEQVWTSDAVAVQCWRSGGAVFGKCL